MTLSLTSYSVRTALAFCLSVFGESRLPPIKSTKNPAAMASCGNFMHDHYQGHMGHITLMLTTTTRLGAGMGNMSVCTPSSRDASATLKSDSQKRSH